MNKSLPNFVVRLHALMTAGRRGLPDFLIIGAQKAGTSSLYNYLARHPDLAASRWRKEINYFEKRYRRGLRWYRSHFPLAEDARLAFEASTNYLYHPLVPERVHRALPGVRLVVLLRDPVERAFSHYQHLVRTNEEPLSFEEAIAREAERLAGTHERIIANPGFASYAHRNYSYLARGRYLEQIERWHRYFAPERLAIYSSDEFFAAPADVANRVCEFVGVGPHPAAFDRKYNVGGYTDGIAPETLQQLRDYFAPYNQALYAYLKREFPWPAADQ